MATTALVIGLARDPAPASAGGLELVYSVAFGLDGGAVDISTVTVIIAANDSANVINGKMSAAVSSLATSLGYTLAKTAITTLPYGKG